MDPDLTRLDDALDRLGVDGYLMDDGATLADQRYLTGFDAEDPFVSVYTPDELGLLVSTLEYERTTRESRADTVENWATYYGDDDDDKERHEMIADFLGDFDVESVAVNQRFPLFTADGLRDAGLEVVVDDETTIEDIRARKTNQEVEWIQTVQRANEDAMRAAEDLIANADVEDGVLQHDGDALTSERVKEEIEITLLRHGCGLDDTIVACGEQCAVPHDRGSGPLRTDETIIIDIFPRSKDTRYHSDMTRTFCRGTPSDEARDFYDITQGAKEAALDVLEAGVLGSAVDDAVCDVYEEAGYSTLRQSRTADTGFFHSTGHGVGLEVHEDPRVGQRADDELEAGHVVTIEPGLYDPAVGGVRIEDIVVVTEDGYENLVDYPEAFVL